MNPLSGIAAHLPALPVLLPLLTAVLLVLAGDGQDNRDRNAAHRVALRARLIGLVSLGIGLALSVWMMVDTHVTGLRVYRMGEWPAPFGIVLVVDRLSALMVLLTQVVALPVAAYAAGHWDGRGRHFHALLQFQVMGLNGAFVTGDLFNLFVFFEVLLIASYVLLVHGHGPARLRVGVPYVALNLAASGLFLIGLALLYSVTGSLNLADIAVRVPGVTGTEGAMLRVAGLLLLVVFGFKAALLPLHLWLPATYAAASPPVAALFALMTKVGVYAILRVHGMAFGEQAGESALLAAPWLLPTALLGSLMAVLGAVAATTLARMIAWLTVASVGTVLAAVSLHTQAAWSAAIYYTFHSTLVVAGLFLLAELLARQRGEAGDRLLTAIPLVQPALLGTLMLVLAASMIGLPPLPGFLGKVMILQASQGVLAPWIWTTLLLVGFLSLLALARAGIIMFWNVEAHAEATATQPQRSASARDVSSVLALVLAIVAMSVFASPLKAYTDAAAAQLADPAGMARAVLGEGAAVPVRPYSPELPR
jgi:multicomponent K+:H+ antiporter subunit D